MKRIAYSGLLLALLATSGCATRQPTALKSLTLSAAPAAATLHKTAALTYLSGTVDGTLVQPTVVSGNVLFSVPPEQGSGLFFNLADQSDATEALHANLLRLKVFDAVELSSSPRSQPDLKITLIFAKTFYEANFQQYTLDAALHIEGGKARFSKRYRAQSNPQRSVLAAARLSSDEAKAQATRALLDQLLVDIQSYASNKG